MRRLIPVLLLLTACKGDQIFIPSDENPIDPGDTGDVIGGPQPDIEVEPDVLPFGFRQTECPSDPLPVTVRNVGDDDLVVDAISIGGDAAVFSHDGAAFTLAAGASREVEVSFAPSEWVPYAASLVVSSNDPDEGEVEVSLTGTGSEDAVFEERFSQVAPSAVDVLWIIDNSGSMSGIVDDLSANMPTFINSFIGLGLDWQMGVVTTDMDDLAHQGQLRGVGVISPSTVADPVSAFTEAAAVGDGGSGDERARDAAYAALTEPLLSGANAGLVRAGGSLALIVISDEEDSSRNIDKRAFSTWLNAFKGDPDDSSFSAMAGPEGTGGLFDPGCQDLANDISAVASVEYPYVVNATGGFYTEICDMNFNQVLTYLSYTAAGMLTRWPLRYTPSNVGRIDVTVRGLDVPYNIVNGFTYDSPSNAVVFHGSWVPQPLDEVVITYPYPNGC